VLIHADEVFLDGFIDVHGGAGGLGAPFGGGGGGGGRVLVLTTSGALAAGSNLLFDVSGGLGGTIAGNGDPGVVEFGRLDSSTTQVPELATLALLAIGLGAYRSIPRRTR
jgi:hypothetical protein